MLAASLCAVSLPGIAIDGFTVRLEARAVMVAVNLASLRLPPDSPEAEAERAVVLLHELTHVARIRCSETPTPSEPRRSTARLPCAATPASYSSNPSTAAASLLQLNITFGNPGCWVCRRTETKITVPSCVDNARRSNAKGTCGDGLGVLRAPVQAARHGRERPRALHHVALLTHESIRAWSPTVERNATITINGDSAMGSSARRSRARRNSSGPCWPQALPSSTLTSGHLSVGKAIELL